MSTRPDGTLQMDSPSPLWFWQADGVRLNGACMFLLPRGRVKYATVGTSWTRCAPVRARIFVRIPVSSLFLLRGLNQMLHYNSPAPLALTPAPLALTSPHSHFHSHAHSSTHVSSLLLLSIHSSRSHFCRPNSIALPLAYSHCSSYRTPN